MPNWTPSTFGGHPYLTFSSLPGQYLSEVIRMVRGVQLDPETRGGASDLPNPTIHHLVGSLVLDEEFSKTASGQYRVYRPLPEQVIFLQSDKDVRVSPKENSNVESSDGKTESLDQKDEI
jgi:hypothetical protein